MKRLTQVHSVRATVREWRRNGLRIGFVPTMGYLHQGHLSLVDAAAERTDRVVVSIYVNPTQFAPGEDLDAYPRDIERDEALCRERGVAAVFYPGDDAMYAPDHSTWVVEDALSRPLCGTSRPTHFRGVATVVTKLFNIVQPDVAAFGQKDAQQAIVIARVVRDLNMPVEIAVCPIVREADGLAMSSRNKYLSPDQRRRAPAIYKGLQAAEKLYAGGERDAARLRAVVAREIGAAQGSPDYIELVSRETLESVETVAGPALLACAVFFGSTRLIDNVFLG
jgi:pantoate--beta-alanine ligase